MGIERRMDRSMFAAEQWVQLKQHCFTPGKVFEPGRYLAGDLPDTAFAMGLVEGLPPVRGKSAEHPRKSSSPPASTET